MYHAVPQQPGDAEWDGLTPSERFLLWGFRAWACCCRGKRLPAAPVGHAFAEIGIPAGAAALDAAMTRLVLGTQRPLAVHCPPEPHLSDDERLLLAAAGAAQRHDRCMARDLFGDLLAGPAADLVGLALVDLGLLLASVGMVVPRPEPGHGTRPEPSRGMLPQPEPSRGTRPGQRFAVTLH